MNIVGYLLKKYLFFNERIDSIIYNDAFRYIKQMSYSTLFVFDKNVENIADHYMPYGATFFKFKELRAKPTNENVEKVINKINENDIKNICAFGTGAINDICKVAAMRTKSNYTFIPTALSMNGIVSNNASIYDGKIKQSIASKTARTIIIEPYIIENAPEKFMASAIMDSLAGYTANNDFLFANNIDSEKYYYDSTLFPIFHDRMQMVLELIYKNPNDFYQHKNIIQYVFELLYVSGCIMNYYEGSTPFSGGEHYIAHTIESRNPQISDDFLHGEVISAILPFYANLQKMYSHKCNISQQTILKNLDIDFKEIASLLKMPNNAKDLGISEDEFYTCVELAKNAKDRPTLLNVVYD